MEVLKTLKSSQVMTERRLEDVYINYCYSLIFAASFYMRVEENKS